DMEEQLDLAAELGIEVFVLDDGWFKGWQEGAGWGVGAGWWVADEKKFPGGLLAFVEKVKARGMRFGLWIEPERIDPAVLAESGVDERWPAASRDNVPFPRSAHNRWAHPCFGCPETVEWAKRQIDRLVVDYGADWIKWDHNAYRVCRRSDHGHQEGDGNWAHVMGVYEQLRQKDLLLNLTPYMQRDFTEEEIADFYTAVWEASFTRFGRHAGEQY